MIPGTVTKVSDVLSFIATSLTWLNVPDNQKQTIAKLILLLNAQIQYLQDSLTDEEIKAELEFLGIDCSDIVYKLKQMLMDRNNDKK
jgi:hypothetical protein